MVLNCIYFMIKAIISCLCWCFPHFGGLSILDWPVLQIVLRRKVQYIWLENLTCIDDEILESRGTSISIHFSTSCSQRWDNILRCNLLFGLIAHLVLLKDVNFSFFLSLSSLSERKTLFFSTLSNHRMNGLSHKLHLHVLYGDLLFSKNIPSMGISCLNTFCLFF